VAKPVNVDLAAFFDRVIASRQAVLAEFNCQVDLKNAKQAWFDPTLMQQVFENLINNSVQAASAEPVRISIEVEQHSSLLKIRFADNGPGIAADLRNRLFTPFVTGRNDGSGFGLALIKKLVEAHSGEIRYIDDKTAGAVFLIEVALNEHSGCR
jgi:signal transduction histidine kinase